MEDRPHHLALLPDDLRFAIAERTAITGQLGLFDAAPAREDVHGRSSERLEQERREAAAIATRLPEGVRFGTSSWSFPDWEGLVYSRRRTTAELAREGLREYAQHPLLRTVGIDRGYYAPIPVADLERYASQLPAGFPCCAKAPEAVTSPVVTDRSRGQAVANPDYLRPDRFLEEMVGPFNAAFRDHTGPFVIQFPPAPAGFRPAPREFAERLDRFLSALPVSLRYAVELRDPSLLTEDYTRVLGAHRAAHVYNYATAMPLPADQAAVVPITTASFTMIRLLLPPGTRYTERRDALWPFNRISDPDPVMRRQVDQILRESVDGGLPAYVLVNNKAEGCSPATIRALAERLAEWTAP